MNALPEDSKHDVVIAILMRINFLETGDPTLNRNDAIVRNDATIRSFNKGYSNERNKLIPIKDLDDYQLALIQRLKEAIRIIREQ